MKYGIPLMAKGLAEDNFFVLLRFGLFCHVGVFLRAMLGVSISAEGHVMAVP